MNPVKSVFTPIASTVGPADVEPAVAALVLAFSADPVTRWTYPDPGQYLAMFPTLVRAFGGGAFTHGSARQVGNHAGVALWLPPGIEPDQAALEASLPAGREGEFSGVFEAMGSYHPHEDHWYLPLIGVDPVHQGKGCGAALLDDVLSQCDRDHVAAYLEFHQFDEFHAVSTTWVRAPGHHPGGIVAAAVSDVSPSSLNAPPRAAGAVHRSQRRPFPASRYAAPPAMPSPRFAKPGFPC